MVMTQAQKDAAKRSRDRKTAAALKGGWEPMHGGFGVKKYHSEAERKAAQRLNAQIWRSKPINKQRMKDRQKSDRILLREYKIQKGIYHPRSYHALRGTSSHKMPAHMMERYGGGSSSLVRKSSPLLGDITEKPSSTGRYPKRTRNILTY